MCGIAGIYNLNGQAIEANKLLDMTRIIRHRGPDDEGYLLVNTQQNVVTHCHANETMPEIKAQTPYLLGQPLANLGFGFRRLSILDLSANGHQPMCNTNQSIWIIYNGEIYNYLELRTELKQLGYIFVSNSDTEVIIKAYEHWGEDCLTKFNGMWAFALWDNNKQKLFCARDRFGVKPFAYYFDGNRFIFGSEIKQLLLHNIDKSINEEVILKSFTIGSFLINSNSSYYKNIQLLPHSHFLTIENGKINITRYYNLPINNFETSTYNFETACEKYRELFTDSIKLRMRSDVEVGSTLSGGLDSSAIVSIAAKQTIKQFKTFTFYFNGNAKYDERKWVKLLANKTGVSDFYTTTNPNTVLNDLNQITWFHDYPLSGSSPIAQYYVMQLAKQNNVTVLLDGQGSDEITGGYNHTFYRYYADMLRKLKLIPLLNEYPSYLKHNQKGSAIDKIIKTLAVSVLSESALYNKEAKSKKHLLNLSFTNTNPITEAIDIAGTSKLSNFLYNQVMGTCIQTLLHFEDRNSMAHSIESRVPFLDYRLVEYSFSLPSKYKIFKNYGKYIHREALRNIVPAEIMQRKDKVGFVAPGESQWMRNEFKPLILEMLNSSDFKNRSLFNHKLINTQFEQYFKGDNSNAQQLWQVFATELWFRGSSH